MSIYANAMYTKEGAVFANSEEAYADKNSLYTVEFSQQVADCYTKMLADGVLLEPVSYTWNQDNFVLTVIKHVNSLAEYQAALTFDSVAGSQLSANAGWTLVL